MTLALTEEQEAAQAEILAWAGARDPSRPGFKLFGLAGTGKTTLAGVVTPQLGEKVLTAAYTGKAAHMLRKKGVSSAGTIHSLIYKLLDDSNPLKPRFGLNRQSQLAAADLLVLDECSMVDQATARDLFSFKTPILILGDPGQLPPIAGESYFSSNPDVLLTEIQRQAKESPILSLALKARRGERIWPGRYAGPAVQKVRSLPVEELAAFDQVLCGLNSTRRRLNLALRRVVQGTCAPLPVVGDRLICLKNYHKMGLFNGMELEVLEERRNLEHGAEYVLGQEGQSWRLNLHEGPFRTYRNPEARNVQIPKAQWKEYQMFDFAYAITTHKAQGSQWDRVAVVDESWAFRENSHRWLYTALTRAVEELTILEKGV